MTIGYLVYMHTLMSFGHAVALMEILFYMHSHKLVWSCSDSIGNLVYMHALMFVWSGCDYIGYLLYACSYARLSMVWLSLEFGFICMHLCSFGHALALLGILLYMHALMFACLCDDLIKI